MSLKILPMILFGPMWRYQTFWGVVSKEWTRTTWFQIQRTRLPEGYKWANGRPTKIQKTTRPDSIWLEAKTQLSRKQQEKIALLSEKKVPHCKQHAATEESTRYGPMTKIASRWLLMLVWNWKRHCSCCAVHCDGRQSREASNLCDFCQCLLGTNRCRNDTSMRKKWSEHIWTTFPKKGMWEAFTARVSFSRSSKDTRSQSRSG